MSQQTNIMVVDDAPDSRLLLKLLLEDDYTVIEAESGEESLQKIEQQMPDLLLLDVNMPGMNGYEVCEYLRKQEATKYLPIIFVSAQDSAEERLAGFEVGADDYIIKPVEHEKLMTTVTGYLQRQQEVVKAKTDAAEAMRVAMEAMTVSSELGQIVQFIKDMPLCLTVDNVVEAVLGVIQIFGLDAALRVKMDKVILVGCKEGSSEANVLARFANHSERILSIGLHTVIRSDHIELLIKEMPLDDENRYGRLKDHLAVLMDIANGHLITLEARMAVVQQRQKFLGQVIAIAEEQIKLTSNKLLKHDQRSQSIMQEMLTKLEGMLFGLGLEDDQEKRLMALADQASLELEQEKSETQDLSSELGVILECLYEFLENAQ